MHCFLNTVKTPSVLAAKGECNTFLPAGLGAEGSNISSSKAVAGKQIERHRRMRKMHLIHCQTHFERAQQNILKILIKVLQLVE
jgi:hypothetical protein